MTRTLFICSQNRLRSPTAAKLFSTWPNVEARSAGLDKSAVVVVSPDLLNWADIIFVMENAHRSKLAKKFKDHLGGKRLICLHISDDYDYMEPLLVHILEAKAGPYLRQP